MSVLIVGLSHKSAPLEVIERVAADADLAVKLALDALETSSVSEAAVISTCNRVEVYVESERFHGAVEQISQLLADHGRLGRDELVRHVYVHYDDAAVAHLFAVAAGLDSMILGESQILGQVRAALHTGQRESTVGPALNALFQQALRIGKRGHAETGIDRLAPSVVTAGLDAVSAVVAEPSARILVVGAGTMAGLTVRTLLERGVDADRVLVANRTRRPAEQLADALGVRALSWAELDAGLVAADAVISCTGARGIVVEADRVRRATAGRSVVLVDLALPRDVDPAVGQLPDVTLVDLATLAARAENAGLAEDVDRVRAIVDDEVGSFLAAKSAARATPAVVALRSMAGEVVEAEAARVIGRLGLDDEHARQVREALRRTAEKILHTPTVRVQQLVDGPEGLSYADALAHLFALDPGAVAAVTTPGGEDT